MTDREKLCFMHGVFGGIHKADMNLTYQVAGALGLSPDCLNGDNAEVQNDLNRVLEAISTK